MKKISKDINSKYVDSRDLDHLLICASYFHLTSNSCSILPNTWRD